MASIHNRFPTIDSKVDKSPIYFHVLSEVQRKGQEMLSMKNKSVVYKLKAIE